MDKPASNTAILPAWDRVNNLSDSPLCVKEVCGLGFINEEKTIEKCHYNILGMYYFIYSALLSALLYLFRLCKNSDDPVSLSRCVKTSTLAVLSKSPVSAPCTFSLLSFFCFS
jgi:hypothetical protein